MAIKIIKKCEKPKEIECNLCDSILAYKDSDVQHCSDGRIFLTCPVCSNIISLKNN